MSPYFPLKRGPEKDEILCKIEYFSLSMINSYVRKILWNELLQKFFLS